MTTIPRTPRFPAALLAVGALSAFAAPAAFGALTASPNPSTTGSYTVSGSVTTARSYEWMSLIETAPGGTTTHFGVSDAKNISQSFSGKAVGTYVYRVEGCYFEYLFDIQEVIDRCEYVGASLSVVVQQPAADLKPSFSATPAASRSWKQNEAITAFTFEAATGGDAPLTYSASGLPSGVTMSNTRRISGTPTAAGRGTATITVRDADGDTAGKSFSWTAMEREDPPNPPVLPLLPAQYWVAGDPIEALALPAASGGDAPIGYSISGLPTGLVMSSARVVSGTPSAAGTGTATLMARDNNGDTSSRTFSWTVTEDLTPSLGDRTIAAQSWEAGSEIVTFPAPTASGGNAPLQYGARGLPDGVALVRSGDPATHAFSGTPTKAGSGTATLVVVDQDGDRATLSFAWTVAADTAPSFGSASVSAKTWTLGEAIGAFTLPAATGGNAPLSYGARGQPRGVTVSPSRQVSGVPLAAGSGTLILTAMDADGDTATLTFAWTVASSDAPTGTLLSVNPEPTTTNDFTIVSIYTATRDYTALTLTETGPTGHTSVYSPTGRRFSQPIVNRANGTYTYVLTECYLKQVSQRREGKEIQEVEEVCEPVGNPLTVTVAGPTPDSVAAQLDDTWEARVGDFDGDGMKDVYLKRTSAAVGGGLLRDVILRQATGGAFSAEPAPPGSTNAATVATWPVSKVVDLVLSDIDLDGFVDVWVRGLGTAIGATNVPDQMVYAPGRRPEVVLNAVDDDVKNFLGEVDAWFRDPGYFQRKVTTRTEARVRLQTRCLSESGDRYGPDLDDVCWSEPVVSVRTVSSPTNLSDEARTFADQFHVDEGKIDPDVTPGSSAASALSRTLKRVFGVEIFGGRLESTCTGSFTYEDHLDLPCDKPHLFGRTILGWVLDIFGAAAQAQTTDTSVTVQLPSPSPGLHTYGADFPQGWDATCPEGSATPCTHRTGQYGTSGTINAVVELGKEWKKEYPNGPPIYVGDISVENGRAWPTYENGEPWHNGHRDGDRVDIRPIHNDGSAETLTWESPDYDQEKTKDLIKTLLDLDALIRAHRETFAGLGCLLMAQQRLHRSMQGAIGSRNVAGSGLVALAPARFDGAGRGLPAAGGVGRGVGASSRRGRGARLQRDHGPVQPVQPEVRLRKAQAHPARRADHVCRRAHHVPDDRADAVPARAFRQRLVLHRAQQDLGDLAQRVERLVGAVAAARRMVQVHVPKRTLEGVLLALLAPVAPNQLLQGQVVARHQHHRVPRDQKRLAVLRPAPNHHVALLLVPPARPVRREDRLLLHADVRPRGVGQPFDLFQNRRAPPVVRHADRVVPSMRCARANQLALVVRVVRPQPRRRPRRHRLGAPLQQLAPVQRHPPAARLQLPRRPQTADERRVQPVAPLAVVVPARALEQMPVNLDAGPVDEQRNIAPGLQLVADNRRRDALGELHRRAPKTLHVARPEPGQPFPRPARFRNLAQPEQGARHRVGAQRVKIRQRPVPARQRRDHRPQRLRVRRAARADLDLDRLVEKFEQTKTPRRLRQDRRPAERRQVQIRELELDLRRADLALLQTSPAK